MNKEKKIIGIFDLVGSFAEDKDRAQFIRTKLLAPYLKDGFDVVLDYSKVDSTTQSFTHALLRENVKDFGIEILDRIYFKNCNEIVQKIIEIVIRYFQQNVVD
ncbi:MAG: hypothetical protein ACD_19C00020G0002 [uncultured bacterium]|nr:MAG: hypothetical protein ACD_19C00020G0002 [uncultured bacterium]